MGVYTLSSCRPWAAPAGYIACAAGPRVGDDEGALLASRSVVQPASRI